ncbi:MAG: succinate dehydrogenase, cytochrome b556 subunit [Gammaproteobacteria bacterium]
MPSTHRPLSPHLQIYKPQLTSVLSITHRATGVFLALGALCFSFWIVAIAAGPKMFAQLTGYIGTWYGQAILFAVVFSLYFHLCNGVRHLFWDMGWGLTIATTYRSGYAVIAVTAVLTVATFAMGGGT